MRQKQSGSPAAGMNFRRSRGVEQDLPDGIRPVSCSTASSIRPEPTSIVGYGRANLPTPSVFVARIHEVRACWHS